MGHFCAPESKSKQNLTNQFTEISEHARVQKKTQPQAHPWPSTRATQEGTGNITARFSNMQEELRKHWKITKMRVCWGGWGGLGDH